MGRDEMFMEKNVRQNSFADLKKALTAAPTVLTERGGVHLCHWPPLGLLLILGKQGMMADTKDKRQEIG